MGRQSVPVVVLGLALAACCASSAAEDRPGWAQRYLEHPPQAWDGWRNSLAPKGEAAGPLDLEVDGKTEYVIVIPTSPTASETRAASELRLWLGGITGADFPILSDSEPPQRADDPWRYSNETDTAVACRRACGPHQRVGGRRPGGAA